MTCTAFFKPARIFPLTLSSAIVLGLAPNAYAGLVQYIDANQAQYGKAPRINVCKKGGGFNISMLSIKGEIAGGWFDDRSRVSLDFDSKIEDTPAKIVHLKRIDKINFPGQPSTETTLLSVHTTTGELYRFEIGYTCPNNYDTGILASKDSKIKAPKTPKKTTKHQAQEPETKAQSKEVIQPTAKPEKMELPEDSDPEWQLPTQQYILDLSSKGPQWSPYLQQAVEEQPEEITEPVNIPVPTTDDLSLLDQSVVELPTEDETGEVLPAPVEQDFAPVEDPVDLGLESAENQAPKAPAKKTVAKAGKDQTTLNNSQIAWYLSRGLFNAGHAGYINRGTTAHRLWNSIVARVRDGQDMQTAIQHVAPVGKMADFQRVGANLLKMGGLK